MDALMHRVDEEFAQALSQEPGFVSYFAIDTGDGTIETVSLFRDETAAIRSEELAADYVRDDLAEYELTVIDVTAGEVLVSRATTETLQAAHRWQGPRARARQAASAAAVRGATERPILVVGATGRTGRMIVDRLLDQGLTVRALVRDEARGRAMLPPGVQLFVGDVRRPHTLAEPIAGAGAMIVAASPGTAHDNSAEMVDYFGTANLVRQATAADLGLLVFVSSIHATRAAHYLDVEASSLGWKARAEELVRSSGIPYCIIRPGWLTDGPGGEPLMFSQHDSIEGRLARADLAEVCAQALALPSARGMTIDVVATPAGSGMPLDVALAGMAPDTGPASAPSPSRSPHVVA
jgi:uncharacterized protein YbjT (DUF2867 family)